MVKVLFWCFLNVILYLIYKIFDKFFCLKFFFECFVNVCWYFLWVDNFFILKFFDLYMFYVEREEIIIFYLYSIIYVNFGVLI